MTIDATVKGASANSYVTIAEADNYFAGRLNSTSWLAASATTKEQALRQATTALERFVVWKGTKATDTQSLQWPRYNVRDAHGFQGYSWYFPGDIIPKFVKDAQCEEALSLILADLFREVDSSGISSVSAGAVAVTFDKTTTPRMLGRATREMIGEYGFFDAGVGARVVAVGRS